MNTILTRRLFTLLLFSAVVPSVLFSAEEFSATKDPGLLKEMIERDNVAETRMFILLDGDVDAKIDDDFSLLYYAVKKDKVKIAKLLIENKADIRGTEDYELDSPLLMAVKGNSLEMVRLLIAHRADPNADEQGFKYFPLFCAAENNNPDIVRLLAKSKANLDEEGP